MSLTTVEVAKIKHHHKYCSGYVAKLGNYYTMYKRNSYLPELFSDYNITKCPECEEGFQKLLADYKSFRVQDAMRKLSNAVPR